MRTSIRVIHFVQQRNSVCQTMIGSCMRETTETFENGIVRQFDGIGLMARGDLLMVIYAADASIRRSTWVFGAAEKLSAQSGRSIQALLIIPEGVKPPDNATREAESAAYERLGAQLRRIVGVPEGGGFRLSFVRLVFYAHAAVTGKKRQFMLAKDVQEALELLRETATERTPAATQIIADLAKIQSELSR